jgi:hypothetical protein
MVYVKYNLFTKNQGFIIDNYASYGLSKICVNYNSFTGTSGVILEVEQTSTTADMDASQNFWGTSNTTIIDSMIYDKNDDASCSSLINYVPILDAPDPEVPIAPTPTPTPTPPSATSEPTPLPSTSPDPSPSPSPSNGPTTSPTPTTNPTNSQTPEPTSNTANPTSNSTADSTINPNSADSSPTSSSQEQPTSSISTQNLPEQQPTPTNSPPVFDTSKNYLQIIIMVALVALAIGLTVAFVKRKW